jgi:homocysteine S-methyltransferase
VNPFAPFLQSQGFIVLDGGLATTLEARGHSLDSKLWSADLLVRDPGAIREVHAAYLEAGADCVTTSGYQASMGGFRAAGLSSSEARRLLELSVELAVEEKERFWATPENRADRVEPIIAASAGPYGAFLADGSEYDGRYGVDASVLDAFHRARLEVLAGTRADVIAFETVPSALEARTIAGLLADFPATWAWITFSCRDGQRLWDGTPIGDVVRACGTPANLVGVGVNCTAPRLVASLVARVRADTDLPIIAYPNSGETYDARTGSWIGDAAMEQWLAGVRDWVAAGARVVGGCCRVGPDVIRRLRLLLKVALSA